MNKVACYKPRITQNQLKFSKTKLDSLIQGSPLPFADSSHATLNVEMWFLFREFFDGLETDGAVKMSMKLLARANMSPLASSFTFINVTNIQSIQTSPAPRAFLYTRV